MDMKSNPLFLGNKKLHAATNLTFDEGVIRTRPGFRYSSLGAEGQFQGACEYRPQEGISSSKFSELDSGIAVVADGVLWFKCNPISEAIFDGTGSVNLYQAENYLILQNTETDTFWWDGDGELVRSPGMTEQDWSEPEVPVQELEVVAPIADIPDCEIDGAESGIDVRFLVIDNATELPVEGVVWTVKRNGTRAYHGLSDTDGRFTFNPRPRVYTYDLRKDGYDAIENVQLEINGTGIERSWDDCLPPTVEIVGEYDFIVRMTSSEVVPTTCELTATNISSGVLEEEFVGEITLTNTGEVAVTVTGISSTIPLIGISVSFPFTIEVGASQILAFQADASLIGAELTIATSCPGEGFVVVFPACSFTITDIRVDTDAGGFTDPNDLEEWNLGQFTVNNTGGTAITVTAYNGVGSYILPELPVVILPGNAEMFSVGGFIGEVSTPNTTFTIETTCGESEEQTYPFPPGYIPPEL